MNNIFVNHYSVPSLSPHQGHYQPVHKLINYLYYIVKKHLRAQEVAKDNNLPCIYLGKLINNLKYIYY